VLAQPLVLGASGLMMTVEFLADKIPAVDSCGTVHTLIRIPRERRWRRRCLGGRSGPWTTVAALLGGSLAATSHFHQGRRPSADHTSPEPFSNVVASTAEDVLAGGLLLLVLAYPWVAAGVVLMLCCWRSGCCRSSSASSSACCGGSPAARPRRSNCGEAAAVPAGRRRLARRLRDRAGAGQAPAPGADLFAVEPAAFLRGADRRAGWRSRQSSSTCARRRSTSASCCGCSTGSGRPTTAAGA